MGFPLPVPKRWLSGQEGRSGAGLWPRGMLLEETWAVSEERLLLEVWMSSDPALILKQATESWSPSTTSWLLLIISKDRNSTSSLGSLYHRSGTLTVKTCSLMYPGVQFVASPPVLSLGTTGKSLTPSSLHRPFRYFVHG